jgi:hypothetical protein
MPQLLAEHVEPGVIGHWEMCILTSIRWSESSPYVFSISRPVFGASELLSFCPV